MDVADNGGGGVIPLGPPAAMQRAANATNPVPEKETRRNAKGIAEDFFVDRNPKSPTFGQEIQKSGTIATRAPMPTKPRATATPPDKGKVETYAQAILEQFNGDPDKAVAAVPGLKSMPPEYKLAVQNAIRSLKRPGQPAKKGSLAERILSNLNAKEKAKLQAPPQ